MRARIPLKVSLRVPFIMACLAQAAMQVLAQTSPSTTIVVTGNPLRERDLQQPLATLAGDALLQRRASTLGETLDGLPGVAATAFGPNVSRPVIRGQDGERVRVLANSGATLDAAALSYDHAVPIDPLVVERVEVLRGPAALLYGGSAVGGVVNLIDSRIATVRPDALRARTEWRLGGAANERSGAVVLDVPLGAAASPGRQDAVGWVLHADAFGRHAGDLRVPAFNVLAESGEAEQRQRVANSGLRSEGGAVGLSWVGTQGHAGMSFDSYRTTYGVVVEPDVSIRMRRERLAAAAEWRGTGAIEAWRWQAARTLYRHEEVEGTGEIGTTFSNRGGDLRVEAVQRERRLGMLRWHGVVGLQAERADFAALGEEAFVPSTHTQQSAWFAMQSLSTPSGLRIGLGLRGERVRVSSAGDASTLDEPRFGPAQSRSFSPRNATLSAQWPLARDWQLALQWASSQRAPSSAELFANGVHLATAAYEQGDPAQRLERGRNLELGLRWQGAAVGGQTGPSLSLSAFRSRFSNYIALLASGETVETEDGEQLPMMAFRGVAAQLSGLELQGRLPIGARFTWEGTLDTLRGTNLSQAEPLPRIAPLRVRNALSYHAAPWTLRAELQHNARQSRVPSDDSATAAFTQLHVDVAYSWRWRGVLAGSAANPGAGEADEARVFLRGRNITNQLGFNATSINTVRTLSPLAGRSWMVGLRLALP